MQSIANRAAPDTIAAPLEDRPGRCRPTARNGQRTAIDAAKLLELVRAPSPPTNPEERVPQLALAAATWVGADSWMVILLEETDGRPRILRPHPPSCLASERAHEEWTREEEGALRDAIVSGKPILSDRRKVRSADQAAKRRPAPDTARNVIACPVTIGEAIVGAIGVVGARARRRFRPDDVIAVEIAAWLVAQSLHAGRLQKLLRSQFAQIAVAREAGHSPDNALAVSGGKPGQLVRILAKSFYREMIKLGFESGQIIGAASEIISQLSGNLKKHKERWQRSEAGRQRLAAGLP